MYALYQGRRRHRPVNSHWVDLASGGGGRRRRREDVFDDSFEDQYDHLHEYLPPAAPSSVAEDAFPHLSEEKMKDLEHKDVIQRRWDAVEGAVGPIATALGIHSGKATLNLMAEAAKGMYGYVAQHASARVAREARRGAAGKAYSSKQEKNLALAEAKADVDAAHRAIVEHNASAPEHLFSKSAFVPEHLREQDLRDHVEQFKKLDVVHKEASKHRDTVSATPVVSGRGVRDMSLRRAARDHRRRMRVLRYARSLPAERFLSAYYSRKMNGRK